MQCIRRVILDREEPAKVSLVFPCPQFPTGRIPLPALWISNCTTTKFCADWTNRANLRNISYLRNGEGAFSAEELAENFPNAPLSEASYEIRFDPKLRIPSEIWKVQEMVGSECPNFSMENLVAIGGNLMTSLTFARADRTRQ